MPKKKNILVTGGTGFIGSHLVEALLHEGHAVTVPYIEIAPKSYFSLMKFGEKVHLVKLDLTDKKKTIALIKRDNIDFIFHLAAQTIVPSALKDPYYTLYNNIVSTCNLLESIRLQTQVQGIIVASSDKAYGKTKKAYTEISPLAGDHPYDVSKSATDLIAQTYFKTYNTPVVVTRFANVYGEGDLHESRIVPGICKALAKNSTLKIRSNGQYIRDYIYVKDVVSGYMFLFHNFNKVKGEAFNVSTGESFSVIEIIKCAEKSLGTKLKFSIENSAINEIPFQKLNAKKIRQAGWESSYTFASVFPQVFDWYKKYIFVQ